MKSVSPKLVEIITEIQEAFGPVKLSGVGPASDPVKPKVIVNIWGKG